MTGSENRPDNKYTPEHYIARLSIFIALETVLVSLWCYLLLSVGFSTFFSSIMRRAESGSESKMAQEMLSYSEALLDPVAIIIWFLATIGIIIFILFRIKPRGEGGSGTSPLITIYLKSFKKISIILLAIGWLLTIFSIWIMKAVVPWSNISS